MEQGRDRCGHWSSTWNSRVRYAWSGILVGKEEYSGKIRGSKERLSGERDARDFRHCRVETSSGS